MLKQLLQKLLRNHSNENRPPEILLLLLLLLLFGVLSTRQGCGYGGMVIF